MEKLYKKFFFLFLLIAIGLTTYAQTGSDVQNFKEEVSMVVYPNPATTKATIGYTLPNRATVLIRVVDLSGRQLFVLVPKQIQNNGKYEVELNFDKYHIMPGMYIIHMLVDNKTYSKKVIVQ